jgi:2-polyprenyl-3-methyl-5-hydroxy-6-metoxy-1,4-benzoquinol methylase
MNNPTVNHEYSYQHSNLGHHHAYLSAPILDFLSQKKLNNSGELRILDLGCGNGSFTNFMAQQGYEILGIEESPSGIAIAKQQFPNCQFIQASIYDLPYSEIENSFDVVISCEVIEHLLYPKELIRAAKKCLKSNGCAIFTTPYHGYLKNLALALSGKMDGHFTVLWDGGHIKFFSVPTLTELVKSEGYQDIQFKFAGRYPYLWKSMICFCAPIKT